MAPRGKLERRDPRRLPCLSKWPEGNFRGVAGRAGGAPGSVIWVKGARPDVGGGGGKDETRVSNGLFQGENLGIPVPKCKSRLRFGRQHSVPN